MSEFDKKDFGAGLFQFLLFKAKNVDKTKSSSSSEDAFLRRWINYQNYCPKKQRDGIKTDLMKERIMLLNKVQFPWKLSDAEHWDGNLQEPGTVKYPEVLR